MTWEPYDSRGRPNTPKSNPHDINQLSEPLQTRAKAMIADCPHHGELGIVSGYRDPGTQWDLRDERVGRANIWKSSVQVVPITAVPARWNGTEWIGGSHHQTGKAIDFGGTERAMVWMHDNRERYGLARTVRTERWHMEANARDTRTGRIHDNPIALAGREPSPIEPPKEWTDMATEAEVKKAAQDAATAAVAPVLEILKRLETDYLTKGNGVRQVIVEIDKRTEDIASGKRPKG